MCSYHEDNILLCKVCVGSTPVAEASVHFPRCNSFIIRFHLLTGPRW